MTARRKRVSPMTGLPKRAKADFTRIPAVTLRALVCRSGPVPTARV